MISLIWDIKNSSHKLWTFTKAANLALASLFLSPGCQDERSIYDLQFVSILYPSCISCSLSQKLSHVYIIKQSGKMIIILSSSIHFFIQNLTFGTKWTKNYCPHQVWSSLWRQRQAHGLHKTPEKQMGIQKKNYFRGFQKFWRKKWTSKMYDKASSPQLFVSPEAVCWKALCSKGNTSSNGGCFSVMSFVGGVPFFHMIYTSSRTSKVISAVVTLCCYPKRRCQISPKKSKLSNESDLENAKETHLGSHHFTQHPVFGTFPKLNSEFTPEKCLGKEDDVRSFLLGFGKTFQG